MLGGGSERKSRLPGKWAEWQNGVRKGTKEGVRKQEGSRNEERKNEIGQRGREG